MNAARLIAEEDARWRELHEVLHGIAPDRLERPGVTPEGWSVKDTVFHVAAWMADCADQLERMRFGTFVDPLETVQGIDQLNREWFELSRTLDVATVWTELFAAHARMLAEWAALPAITRDAWDWFEESGPLHYRKHVQDLRGWIEGA
ncbi:MAG TPA: maleylpyruvate isomerase N-terminal domain-containing protein [Actinomycetota bacterium]